MTTIQIERRRHRYIDLSSAVVPRMDFGRMDLSFANMTGTNFSGADFSSANLTGAKLADAVLKEANFTDADLSKANLCGADLSEANLQGASLQEADLSGAVLTNANLRGADLSRAQNISWYRLLNGRIDKNTVIPDYLDEKDFWETLEGIWPQSALRSEYSGRIGDLLMELGKIAENLDVQSIGGVLHKMRFHQRHDDSGDV